MFTPILFYRCVKHQIMFAEHLQYCRLQTCFTETFIAIIVFKRVSDMHTTVLFGLELLYFDMDALLSSKWRSLV